MLKHLFSPTGTKFVIKKNVHISVIITFLLLTMKSFLHLAFRLKLLIFMLLFFGSCSQFMPLRDSGSTASYSTTPNNNQYTRMAGNIIRYARDFTGTPYQHGGISGKGMDCSGLVYVAFKKAGIDFPRSTTDQADMGRIVHMSSIRPGDLLFFHTDKKSPYRISHVGIVTHCRGMNDITFIHAANSGVREDNLSADYYKKAFAKAIRPVLTP